MSDTMHIQPFDRLLHWTLKELAENQSIFGIPRSLFFTPQPDSPYATDDLFGHYLATPIGPAAGPHTQLAQNILCAWLSGGRFIELKTVQIMDELEIPRPCIDMEDEGYNVEWSQELKLEESIHEYVNAWALIHILRQVLGFDHIPFGTIFNMSVGYDLEGIQSAPMTRFMDRLADASGEIEDIRGVLADQFPQFADVEIPSQLTDNVTLSTMHGCPPDEIERIGRYLLEERGLHTTIKLNPTLLGQEMVQRILHDDLGFTDIHIPDAVFEHDLQYERAVELITTLKQVAAAHGLTFGVKLSNTLAMANHKRTLPGDEMYMSGRALYPITLNLFHKLAREFDGDLNVSYSAGADALNLTTLLSAGARPVTTASDLLKPGGYSRFLQYIQNLAAEMDRQGADSLEEFAQDKLSNLERAAAEARRHPRYKKSYHPHPLPKVETALSPFDCIAAPCVAQCAVRQDVPAYAWWIAQGEYDQALEVILARNPLPGVTGYVCTHLCQTRCTRSNYDQPVAIRALKRFAAERGDATLPSPPERRDPLPKVGIIGSGPSGLAAAYFLALNGLQVTIFEAQDRPGGMLAIAPPFRLPPEIVRADIDRILDLGVDIQLSHPITQPPETLLSEGFDAVYIACGFQRDARLSIEGIEGRGVFSALEFLSQVARGERPDLGERVLVIGGGNTAMDAARTAQRLIGQRLTDQPLTGQVTVVYRRTRAEMPAEEEELIGLLAEGNRLIELATPLRVVLRDGRVTGLECVRNELGNPGPDGRRRPVPIAGSEFQIPADSIIVAIGQAPDVAFLDGSAVSLHEDGSIAVDPETGQAGSRRVYAGGDAARGPAIIIEACADGRRAAEAILHQLDLPFTSLPGTLPKLTAEEILQVKRIRASKEPPKETELLPVEQRDGFDLIEQTLTEKAARSEAARCVQCATVCDKCVEVCPNRANYTYLVTPARWTLPQLACRDGELVVVGKGEGDGEGESKELFVIEQARQIIHVDDFCNECGNCATFCVHQGKPYIDKPRLFLRREDFEREEDNAFFVEQGIIWRREGGQESRLFQDNGILTFETAHLRVTLTPDLLLQEITLKSAFEEVVSLVAAAEMVLILQGVTRSLPFLIA